MSAAHSATNLPLLASVSDSVKVWAWNDLTKEFSLNTSQQTPGTEYFCVAWNHTNQVLAVGGDKPVITLVSVGNGQVLSSLPLSEGTSGKVRCVGFSNNSRFLATSIGSTVQLWDLKRRQIKCTFSRNDSTIVAVIFTMNGDVFAADERGHIRLWSSKSTEPLLEVQSENSQAILTCMDLSVSNAVLVSGYSDGTIKVWSFSDNQLQFVLEKKLHDGPVRGVSCSPKNHKLVATIGEDGKLHLFDTSKRTSAVVATADTNKSLSCVSFHESGMQAAVGTEDGSILLYDWRNVRKPICNLVAHNGYPIYNLRYQMPKIASKQESNSVISSSSIGASLSSEKTDDAPLRATFSSPGSQQLDSTPSKVNSKQTKSPEKIESIQSSSSARAITPSKVIGSNGMKYEISPLLQKKQSLSEKSDAGSNSGSIKSSNSLPTTEKVALNNKVGSSTLRDPSEITKRVDNLINEYESSIRITAATTLESPRASTAPSRNRYSFHAANDNEESDRLVQDQNSQPKDTNESFSTQYSQRLKDIMDVGGYSKTTFALPAPASPIVKQDMRTDAVRTSYESTVRDEPVEFSDLRQAVRPVTAIELEEALELLKYDIHREVQEIIREQARQFAIAKEDTSTIIFELQKQLSELLRANKELREENEQLRKIY